MSSENCNQQITDLNNQIHHLENINQELQQTCRSMNQIDCAPEYLRGVSKAVGGNVI